MFNAALLAVERTTSLLQSDGWSRQLLSRAKKDTPCSVTYTRGNDTRQNSQREGILKNRLLICRGVLHESRNVKKILLL